MSGQGKTNQFQIILLGDAKVGKTSMIDTYITLTFPEKVESVKTDSIIPPPSHDEYMSCILCDSSDDPTDPVLLQKLGSSDIVFLLHDASRPSTLESIKNTWLPLVKKAFNSDRTKSAVIIRSKNDLFTGVSDYRVSEASRGSGMSDPKSSVGSGEEDVAVSQDGTGPQFSNDNKTDEAGEDQESKSNDMMFSYMGVDITQPDKFSIDELELGKSYSFISALSICSAAKNLDQVVDLFASAEEMFRSPLAPLYTKELGYTNQCMIALQRIFRHHDQDHDGVLSDEEFKKLQFFSLGITISGDELTQMKALIEDISEDYLKPIWTNMFPASSFASSATATTAESPMSSTSSFTSYTGQPLHLSNSSSPRQLVSTSTGITFSGFIKILEMHICRDRQGVVWDILRAHGYGVDVRMPSISEMMRRFNNEEDHSDISDNEDDDTDDEDSKSGNAKEKHKNNDSCSVINENAIVCGPTIHKGCVCSSARPEFNETEYAPSTDTRSSAWVDISSPTTPQSTGQQALTLLTPEAVDFLHGLFSQKKGAHQDLGLKIAPELAFAVSVYSTESAKIWQSIVMANNALAASQPQSSSGSQKPSSPLRSSQKHVMYTLYNPFPTEAAVRNWLTLWHTLAMHLSPQLLSTLLFQLGFMPQIFLQPIDATTDVAVSMAKSSYTLSDSSFSETKENSTLCFACNCLERHTGRAKDLLQIENPNISQTLDRYNSKSYSVRQAIRHIGVFGRDQVGKTSVIAAFSDLYSDSQNERIREKVGNRDVVSGGFCVQSQVASSGDVSASTVNPVGSAKKSKRKNKSFSSPATTKGKHIPVNASTLQASYFVHYIASEVPGYSGNYDEEESSGSSFDHVTSKSKSEVNGMSTSQISSGAESCVSSVVETFHVQEGDHTVNDDDEDFSNLPVARVTDPMSPLPSPVVSQNKLDGPEVHNAHSSITSEDMFSFHGSAMSSVTSETFAEQNRSGCHDCDVAHSEITSDKDVKILNSMEHSELSVEGGGDRIDASASASTSFSFLPNLEDSMSLPPSGSEPRIDVTSSIDSDEKGVESVPTSSRSNSYSHSSTSTICMETRQWIDANKQTCDMALLLFDAFDIETLDYLLEIDAILPQDIVRVFICTKFNQRDSGAASILGSDEAYAKCVDYIRERGLPQVEQLFSLDQSTIVNLERSIHDTFQRSISVASFSRTATSTPTQSTRTEVSTPVSPTSSSPTPTSLFPGDNSDDEMDDEAPPNKNRVTDVTASFFSFSKLFLIFDSAISNYFPSYKYYLPGLVLAPSVVFGLIALYRRTTRAWSYDAKA